MRRKSIRAAVPFPHAGLGIILLLYAVDTDYLLTLSMLLWLTMFLVEYHAVTRKLRVYSRSRLGGLYSLNIPMRQLALYYFLGPVFVVLIFDFLALMPKIAFGRTGSEVVPPGE